KRSNGVVEQWSAGFRNTPSLQHSIVHREVKSKISASGNDDSNSQGASMKPLKGNAWIFRGVLDVDWEICVFEVSHELQAKGIYTPEEIGKYCMTKVDPDFPKKVKKGDFIIGEFMGFGHDHDHACLSILGAGVAAVICETSAPYFLRNSIERGLPVV